MAARCGRLVGGAHTTLSRMRAPVARGLVRKPPARPLSSDIAPGAYAGLFELPEEIKQLQDGARRYCMEQLHVRCPHLLPRNTLRQTHTHMQARTQARTRP